MVLVSPKVSTSMTTATSLTSGEAIRKVRVTASGTPAPTKPMNSGIELHEQNGVMAPNRAASTSDIHKGLPSRKSRTRSGRSVVRSRPMAKIIPTSSNKILAVSYRKKWMAPGTGLARSRWRARVNSASQMTSFVAYSDAQTRAARTSWRVRRRVERGARVVVMDQQPLRVPGKAARMRSSASAARA